MENPTSPSLEPGTKKRSGGFVAPFSFDGRITRTEYGLSVLLYFLVYLVGIVALAKELGGITFIILIPAIWFLYAQGAKRCHDTGTSGWYQLIPFYVFYMLFASGDIGENRFGMDPRGRIGEVVKFEANRSVKLNQQSVGVHARPDENSDVIISLKNGDRFAIMAGTNTVSEKWDTVMLADGTLGYMPSNTNVLLTK